jgi:hypothetical protein
MDDRRGSQHDEPIFHFPREQPSDAERLNEILRQLKISFLPCAGARSGLLVDAAHELQRLCSRGKIWTEVQALSVKRQRYEKRLRSIAIKTRANADELDKMGYPRQASLFRKMADGVSVEPDASLPPVRKPPQKARMAQEFIQWVEKWFAMPIKLRNDDRGQKVGKIINFAEAVAQAWNAPKLSGATLQKELTRANAGKTE